MAAVTLVVLLIVAALVVIGALLIGSAVRRGRAERVCRAASCGHRNAPGAQFCARCGAKLAG